MPKFRVSSQDGAVYEIDGPEGATEEQAQEYFQSQLSQFQAPSLPQFQSYEGEGTESPSLNPLPPSDSAQPAVNEPDAAPNIPTNVTYGLPQDYLAHLQDLFDSGTSADTLKDFVAANSYGGLSPEQQADFNRQIDEAFAGRAKGNQVRFALDDPRPQNPEPEGPSNNPNDPGFVTRQLAALNEGIPDALGFPVDAVNAGLGAVGLPMSDEPIGGSESLRGLMHGAGVGQVDKSYDPQSDPERYTQSASRSVGSVLLPAGGAIASGSRLAASGAPAVARAIAPQLAEGGSAAQNLPAVAKSAMAKANLRAAANPAKFLSTEAAAATGAGLGGQVGRDIAPDSPTVQGLASLIGGAAGGSATLRTGGKAKFLEQQAANPHLYTDAEVAADVATVVRGLSGKDAVGAKIPEAVRSRTLQQRVNTLEKSYLPSVASIRAMEIPQAQKDMLVNAVARRMVLSDDNIDALRFNAEGSTVADAIMKARRLRHYIPEGTGNQANRRSSWGGLATDAAISGAGSALSGPVGGAMGAALSGAARRAVSNSRGGGDPATAILNLAKKAKGLKEVRDQLAAQGRLKNSAASDVPMPDDIAAESSLLADNRRLAVSNDRDNLKPGGGFRGMIYEKTGLLPAQQDTGLLKLFIEGKISKAQYDAALSNPQSLMDGKGGLAVLDRLTSMADDGSLSRDPNWSAPQAIPNNLNNVRNPYSYRAAAEGKQARVTDSLASVQSSDLLDDSVKKTLGSAITRIGSLSDRAEAEAVMLEALDRLPADQQGYADSILSPLVEQIRRKSD